MGNFLDVCNPVKQREGDGSYHNSEYNDWEEECFRKIVENGKVEYKDKILQWLGQKKQESEVQKIFVVRDSGNFSPGQTASIGAGAAAGGAGLAFTIPVLGKWLMRFF